MIYLFNAFAFFVLICLSLPANAQQIAGFNNVYSPHMEFVSGKLKMYFGGWKSAPPLQIRDTLYRAECAHPFLPCKYEQPLLFWDDGKWTEVPARYSAINDPTVVNMGSHLLLFFTACVTGVDCWQSENHQIHMAVSWAGDGIHWSRPTRVVQSAWLPSVTKAANGDVLLYYTRGGNSAELRVLNLGRTGSQRLSDRAVANSARKIYVNVEVRYQPSIGLYQMLGEPLGDHNGIDYLSSRDGVNFRLDHARILAPAAGQVKLRTPAMHPHTASWTYFGSTAREDALENQIYFRAW